jgi:hypothetical protein
MKRAFSIGRRGKALAVTTGFVLCAAVGAAEGIDSALAAWLGREITIDAGANSEQIPAGGKMTLVHDGDDGVVRVCTRNAPEQKQAWGKDLASGCKVTLQFTRGERYCTVEDVKAGDGEVLSSCHRLRSQNVGDMIVFLLAPDQGTNAVAILVDSPSRVTNDPIVIGRF